MLKERSVVTNENTKNSAERDGADISSRAFLHADSALCIVDRDMTFVVVNDAYCKLTQRARRDLVGRHMFEVFPDNPHATAGETSMRSSVQRVFSSGTADTLPLFRFDVDDLQDPGTFIPRYWTVTNTAVLDPTGGVDFVTVHIEEVSSYIEDRFRQQASAEQPLTASITAAIDTVFSIEMDRLRTLNTLAEALASSETTEQVARAFLRDGVALVGAHRGTFIAIRDDHFHMSNDGAESIELWHRSQVDGRSTGIIATALATTDPQFVVRSDGIESALAPLDRTDLVADEAWAVMPLIVSEGTVGVLIVAFDRPEPFTEAIRLALLTVRDLVRQAAARSLLRSEQEATLTSLAAVLEPRLDALPDVRVSTLHRPATQLSLSGGDWFDVLALDPDRTLFVIGDASHHGPGVVGEMARARSTVHDAAFNNLDPSDIARSAARTLHALGNGHTTAVIAVYDRVSQSLAWCTAGHPYPVIKRKDGTVEPLRETHGAPLGVSTPNSYTSSTIHLGQGDTVFLYTDGLIERRQEAFDASLERLVEALTAADTSSDLAQSICTALLGADGNPDDVAILTVTILAPSTASQPG